MSSACFYGYIYKLWATHFNIAFYINGDVQVRGNEIPLPRALPTAPMPPLGPPRPLGTRNKVKCLLKGKPPPFYRRILNDATVPVKRLRRKTTPAPRYCIPAHLRHYDTAPTVPHRQCIRLSRSTVLLGAAAAVQVFPQSTT